MLRGFFFSFLRYARHQKRIHFIARLSLFFTIKLRSTPTYKQCEKEEKRKREREKWLGVGWKKEKKTHLVLDWR